MILIGRIKNMILTSQKRHAYVDHTIPHGTEANNIILEFGASVMPTQEDFETLRNLIVACICREINVNNMRTFHGVDMTKSCARGFLDERGIAQYEFSGEHDYYKDVLERIYRPLAESGLIQENENNNFTIPAESKLHEICTIEINGKAYIIWEDFRSHYLQGS